MIRKILNDLKRPQDYTYHHHVKNMIELGRLAAAGKTLARDTLARLAQGDDWERRISLHACFTSGDGARVIQSITDISDRVRRLAFRVSAHACDDDQALRALQLAWETRRHTPLLLTLSRKGRVIVVDRYLEWLAQEDCIRDLVDALPLGTEATVGRYWTLAINRPSIVFWRRLAHDHPSRFAEYLCEQLELHVGEPDPRIRRLLTLYMETLALRAPDATLKLISALLKRSIIPELKACYHLARSRSAELIQLIVGHHERLAFPPIFERVKLDLESTLTLARHSPQTLGPAVDLRDRLSKDERAQVAEAWALHIERAPAWGLVFIQDLKDQALRVHAAQRWSIAGRDQSGVIRLGELSVLPRSLAAQEARRHLTEVVSLQSQPQARVCYIRYLDWEEANEHAQSWLSHPEGSMRGVALSSLLSIPGYWPERPELVKSALEMLSRRKNEQDPVRAQAFNALLSWPRQVWGSGHLPALARVIRDALDAADLSNHCAACVEKLVVRVFSVDPEWAARSLAMIYQERGRVQQVRIGAQLTEGEVRCAIPHLMKVTREWHKSERDHALISIACSFHARLTHMDELVQQLRERALGSPWTSIRVNIVKLLREHLPDQGDELIEQLMSAADDQNHQELAIELGKALKEDLPAILTKRLVSLAQDASEEWSPYALQILYRSAPDVLDELLPSLLKSDRSFIMIPAVYRAIHQRRQDLLTFLIDDAPVSGCFATGKTRWIIPFSKGFFRWSSTHSAYYERTLEEMIDMESLDLPTRLWSVSQLAELFAVSAQGLCAAARHDTPAISERAISVLARLDASQGLHTLISCLDDVKARYAIYGLRRALLRLPPIRAVNLLMTVKMNKVTVAKEVVRLLGEVRHDKAYAHLSKLAGEDLHRDVRLAMLRALWDHLDREETWEILEDAATGADLFLATKVGEIPAHRLSPQGDLRLSALLARVLERPEPEARIELLRRAAYLALRDPERSLLHACMRRIRSPYQDETVHAVNAVMHRASEEDIPELERILLNGTDDIRSLTIAINRLLQFRASNRQSWRQIIAAAERVCADPKHLALQVRCAAKWRIPEEFAIWLAECEGLHYDGIHAACMALERMPQEQLWPVATCLQQSAYASARRVGLQALVMQSQIGQGWTNARLQLLTMFRQDSDSMVAGAAQRVLPPLEVDPDSATS